MICKMSFDARILYVRVNVTLMKFTIRLGSRIWRKIRESVSSVYRKPFLMRKLEPRHENPPCASSSLFILSKRFVLSIMKHSDTCVIGFLLEILQYSTLPYLFSPADCPRTPPGSSKQPCELGVREVVAVHGLPRILPAGHELPALRRAGDRLETDLSKNHASEEGSGHE